MILNIINIYKFDYLQSACFLINNYESSIITCNISNQEPIKVFDFKGNKKKEINDSKDISYFIDVYYDNNLFKNYIITSNENDVKSYDYNENKLYHQYSNNKESYLNIIINKRKD